MKKYKQFRAEQQHLAEIGPIGAVMMGAMGLFGLGFAGYKMYKRTKEGITGYVESRSQKKDNKKNGMDISMKVYNPISGKEEYKDFYVKPDGTSPDLEKMGVKIKKSDLNTDDAGIPKFEKKLQLGLNQYNKGARREDRAGVMAPDKLDFLKTIHKPRVDKTDDEPTGTPDTSTGKPDTTDKPVTTDDDDEQSPEDELKSKGEKQPDEGGIDNDKEADAFYKLVGKAPTGWESDDDGNVFKKGEKPMKKEPEAESLLSFGQFIAEDVMSDMKKASKSSKDSEIKLGDGTVIPIDKLTAQIFVKYIEGLEKSEQKKTINQIQRTERAFMKVLGQAHEG